ncbi:flagellar basal body P-ring formation chaperone FlgA [uncultured Ramlibacter sp.]|uniref:flagellar basal body P-ring formation chaperone FlgA n=1 Tax=uncultured Ramlibacter sp. TaxID=260755 RepID=UPI002636E284|nr:flagellar basal body P-ring formation chaperone FlgA [uncultured Ramlibacter sp.]
MSLARILSATLLALAAAAPVRAQAVFDENALRSFVSQQVAAAGGDLVSRFDVRLGSLEAQNSLAPCRRSEPFVPANGRLWGRSSLGLRCTDGATWTVLLPVTVTVWGRALVAATPLASGTVLSEQDVREQEIELTREPAALARDPKQLAGRTLARALSPGQAIRADMVRVTSVVQSGDPVRLRISGPGFAVAATGQALGAAGEGQTVRVRTDLGKILLGVAREGRHVDVAL